MSRLDVRREGFWRAQLEQQRASGLGVRAYCRRQRLKESTFHYWRRTLAARAARREASAQPAFIPVTIVEQPPALATPIDIILPGRRRLRVRSGCDRELLAAIIAMLEARPC